MAFYFPLGSTKNSSVRKARSFVIELLQAGIRVVGFLKSFYCAPRHYCAQKQRGMPFGVGSGSNVNLRPWFTLLCFVTFLCAWSAPCSARRAALLIGINKYPKSNDLSELKGPCKDVRALAEQLKDKAGFKAGDIQILATDSVEEDNLPTKSNIIGALGRLQELSRRSDDKLDLVIIYYSGHGIFLPKAGDSFLLTSDVRTNAQEQGLQETAIASKALNSYLCDIQGARILSFYDMCRNDPFQGGTKSFSVGQDKVSADTALSAEMRRDLVLRKDKDGNGPSQSATFFACTPNSVSYEVGIERLDTEISEKGANSGGYSRGVFSYVLEQGLRGAADFGDGITVKNLADYLKTNVPHTVKTRIGGQKEQVPDVVVSDPEAYNFCLVPPPTLPVNLVTDPPGATVTVDLPNFDPIKTPLPLDTAPLNRRLKQEVLLTASYPGYEVARRTFILDRDPITFQYRLGVKADGELNRYFDLTVGKAIDLPPWLLRKLPKATLQLTSEPSEASARVLYKGRVISQKTTPCEVALDLSEFRDQEFVVEVEKEGFEKQISAPVKLSANSTWVMQHPLQPIKKALPTRAILHLDSTPKGAKVFVDGVEQKGLLTPCDIPRDVLDEQSQNVNILLRKDNFEPFTALVGLVPGNTKKLQCALNAVKVQVPDHTAIVNITDPAGAEVQILYKNQVVMAKTSPCEISLNLDKYPGKEFDVNVIKAGFTPFLRTQKLQPGRTSIYPILAPLAPAPDTSASLFLDSTPRGARVYIDGAEQAGLLTPCDIRRDLLDGQQRNIKVELVRDGFDTYTATLGLVPGFHSKAPVVFEMRRAVPAARPERRAFLHIESEPLGAQIYLDDVLLTGKQTPCDVEVDLQGKAQSEIKLRVVKVGYEPKEIRPTVKPGSYHYIPVGELDSLVARLNLTSEPIGAQVLINGKAAGMTPYFVDLPLQAARTGQFRLRLEKEGYDENEFEVTLERGRTAFYRPTLRPVPKPAEGRLSFIIEPAGATIFVNDRLQPRKTPCEITVPFLNRNTQQIDIRIQKDGYETQISKITLGPGGNKDIDGHLQRLVLIENAPQNINVVGGGEGYVISNDRRLLARWDVQSVAVFDSNTSRKIAEVSTGQKINQIAFHPLDNNLIAFCTGNLLSAPQPRVLVWNIATNKTTALEGCNVLSKALLALAFSPDGRYLAAAGGDCRLLLWDTASKALAGEVNLLNLEREVPVQWVTTLALSAQGKVAAIGYGHAIRQRTPGQVELWDIGNLQQPRCALSNSGHDTTVTAVAISNDGQLLASGDSESTIILWDAQSRSKKNEFQARQQLLNIKSLAFSPDSALLACGTGDRQISVFDISNPQAKNGGQLKLLSNQYWAWSVRFADSSKLVATEPGG